MYKTPCCGESVFWLAAINSDPIFPITCRKCGKKYHDEAKRRHRWLFYVGCIIPAITLIGGLAFRNNTLISLGYILGPLPIVIVAIDELVVVKKGALVETTASHKGVQWGKLKWAALIILAALIWELLDAL